MFCVVFGRWVLSNSVFTVLRNEDKFRSRNKSKRTLIESNIFRPEIVQYMKGRLARVSVQRTMTDSVVCLDARVELVTAEGKADLCLADGEAVYTDKQVRGLGKNYMRETSRLAGIAAYTFFIKLYALDALLSCVEDGCVGTDSTVASVDRYCTFCSSCFGFLSVVLTILVSSDCRCSSQYGLATLSEEFERSCLIRDCLSDLVSMKAEVAKMAADGKTRDDVRGQRITPDYSDVHKSVADEPVVLQAWRFGLRTLCLFPFSCG